MTAHEMLRVPGLAALVGRGVYPSVPDRLPDEVHGRRVVVAGEPSAAAEAALRLSACGCDVTMVTREGRREAGLPPDVRRAVRGCPRVTLHYGAEIACVDGIRTIEAVVVRHLASGRLEACNASALFLVFRTPGVVAPLARAVP